MNFCFVASRDWLHPEAAGGDYYLGNLARWLVRRGHTVVFLASSFPGSPRQKRVDGVDIRRLNPGMFFPVRLFLAFLRVRGSTDILVEEVFGGKKIPALGLLYPSRRLVAVWYQRHTRIFAEQYPMPLARVLVLVEKWMARLYRSVPVATLSRKSASELVELGLDPSRIGVVPAAALIGSPSPAELLPFEERDNTMVFIGKIRRYKRIDHTILALKKLSETHPDCRLIIAGNIGENDRNYLASLRDLALHLHIQNVVDFRIYPGAIPQQEKVELLKRSKILLQPSPVEGFSMTTVEANACGTPVVVSDGVPEDSVQPGQNGYVYPFGDIENMSKCCRSLFDERSVWESMSSLGLKMARRFSWEATAETFEAFVSHLFVP